MKTGVASSTFVALALVSSTAASPSLLERALERRNDAPPLPPCANYTPFQYVGCFVDPTGTKNLEYNPGLDFDTMTIETCTASCKVSLSQIPDISGVDR